MIFLPLCKRNMKEFASGKWIFLFLLLSMDKITVTGKLFNDLEQAIVYDTKNLQFSHRDVANSVRRARVLEPLKDDEATGEDDVGSLDSSDLIDDGSIITKQDEETFNSGVHSINQLSHDIKDNDKDKTKKKEKDKKIKNAKDKSTKNEFSSEIDLEYLNELFKEKNISSFQSVYTESLRQKALQNLYEDLTLNKKKVFAGLKNQSKITDPNDSESAIQKIIEEEKGSEKYKISFPLFYHSVGTITLPYDGLVEPFESWYAGELNMSRIDYYQGRKETGKYFML